MYVQVVTIDGKKKTVLNVSKLTKIKDLKKDIENEFGIAKAQQALFFRGKHLENDGTLYDYSININNVIQVSPYYAYLVKFYLKTKNLLL